jgi:hypothetical protein
MVIYMSNHKVSPFSLLSDPSSALAAAQRLSQVLPSRTSTLDARKGKTISDELSRYDEEIDSGR